MECRGVYDGVHCWLASFPRQSQVLVPGETDAERQARVFAAEVAALTALIDEFGYEAVYFGVGCVAFPDAACSE